MIYLKEFFSRDFAPFTIVDPDTNEIVANATITPGSATVPDKVTLTFTKYVERRMNVTGNFSLTTEIRTDYFNTAQEITIETIVNGVAQTIHITTQQRPSNVHFPVDTFKTFGNKGSWLVVPTPTRPVLMGWVVKVNHQIYDDPSEGTLNNVTYPKPYNNVIVDDTFGPFQHYYTDSSVSFSVKINKYVKDDATGGMIIGSSTVIDHALTTNQSALAAHNMELSLKPDGTGFIFIALDVTGIEVELIYYTTIELDPATGEYPSQLTNEAKMSYNEVVNESVSTTRTISISCGGASGILGSVVIKKTNGLTGTSLQNAIFTLYDADTNEVVRDNLATNVNGEYTILNLPIGNYYLKEKTAPNGYTLSQEQYPFRIMSQEQAELRIPISNVQTPVSASLSASKLLEGRTLLVDEFEFEVVNDQGVVVQTVNNKQAGTVSFNPLSYDRAGTYTYTLREKPGTSATLTYDPTIYTATVTVTDVEGQLTAVVAYNADPVFTNTYTPLPVTVTLGATKELVGRTLKVDEFVFRLVNNTVVLQTVKNTLDGKVEYAPIEFNRVGTYSFLIEEVVGSEKNMTYDSEPVKVTVIITDNLGQLEADITYDRNPVFKNTFKVVDPVTPPKPVTPTPPKPVTPEVKPELPNTSGTSNKLINILGTSMIIYGVYSVLKRKED